MSFYCLQGAKSGTFKDKMNKLQVLYIQEAYKTNTKPKEAFSLVGKKQLCELKYRIKVIILIEKEFMPLQFRKDRNVMSKKLSSETF